MRESRLTADKHATTWLDGRSKFKLDVIVSDGGRQKPSLTTTLFGLRV